MDTLRSASGPDTTTSDATFTKWMIGDGPDMAGVVGGAIGAGTYSGTVLDYTPGPTQRVAARYELRGSRRSFTALVYVEQTGLDAQISGIVIEGWRKGHAVRGAYREIECEHDGVTSSCWQGALSVGDD